MAIPLDTSERKILDTDQKALEINLNDKIYGTFAEIGAGQEVARHFFTVGAAAGTIAKTMSAYDKVYSDEIYGTEPKGRYVCESRLYKMLDHEYDLMVERLETHRPETNFFVFADTVAAINYHRTIKGNGWLGLRFQLAPNAYPDEIVLHVKLHDRDQQLQQKAIGILGVNLIHACYNYADNMEFLVSALMDSLAGRICIDMIRVSGPNLGLMEDRLISLYMVKNNLTEVAIFDADGYSIHASEFLYKKSLMVVRGNYKPTTLTSIDVFDAGYEMFLKEDRVEKEKSFFLAEVTMQNLTRDGDLDEKDYLDRVKLLNQLGYSVILSNCNTHQVLVNYLSDYKIKMLGLVIGVWELMELIERIYNENKNGRLLVSFGEIFNAHIKIYCYPALDDNGQLIEGTNLPVPDGIKFLYQHLLEQKQIVDISEYKRDLLYIYPQNALESIDRGDGLWKDMVPADGIELIEKEGLFKKS